MRLYAELYRAGEPKMAPIEIRSDFSTMRLYDHPATPGVGPEVQPVAHREPQVNYGQGSLGFDRGN